MNTKNKNKQKKRFLNNNNNKKNWKVLNKVKTKQKKRRG